MKKIGQKGFGAAGLVLVATVVGLIFVVGWQVYSRQDAFDESSHEPAAQYIKTTDSAQIFSYSYPDHWQIEPYVWEDCCGEIEPEPDWTKVSKPITLSHKYDTKVKITIITDKYGDLWESFVALKTSVREDFYAKVLYEGTRPDGHEALFSRVDYLGPSDAKVESFTDHRYYFHNGDNVLRVEFREKYHHDWPDEETGPDIDNTRYLSDFEHIANSISFTN